MGIMGTAVSLGLAVGPSAGGPAGGHRGLAGHIFWSICRCACFPGGWSSRYVPQATGWETNGERFDVRGAVLLFMALDLLRPGHDPGPAPRLRLTARLRPLLFGATVLAGVALFRLGGALAPNTPMMPLGLFKDGPGVRPGPAHGMDRLFDTGRGVHVCPSICRWPRAIRPSRVGFLHAGGAGEHGRQSRPWRAGAPTASEPPGGEPCGSYTPGGRLPDVERHAPCTFQPFDYVHAGCCPWAWAWGFSKRPTPVPFMGRAPQQSPGGVLGPGVACRAPWATPPACP